MTKTSFFFLISLVGMTGIVTPETHAQKVFAVNEVMTWSDLAKTPGLEGDVVLMNGAADESGIPHFQWSAALPIGNWRAVADLEFGQGTAIPVAGFSTLALQDLTSKYEYSVDIQYGGETPYVTLDLVPVRRSERGQWERLLSFQAEIRIEPAGAEAALRQPLEFAEQSVLAEGTWYRIAIARDGIYRIDKSLLNQLGVQTSGLNPQQINVYGNGGAMLPYLNSTPRPDDLQPNPVYAVGESDGVFNDGDYFLFYGKGPDSWEYNEEKLRFQHTKHHYSDSAYYFIRVDDLNPVRIAPGPVTDLPETAIISTFQDFQFVENDTYNLVKSGREFFGDLFDVNLNGAYNFSFPNALPETGVLDVAVAVRSISQQSSFTFTCNGASVTPETLPVNGGPLAKVADYEPDTLAFIPASGNNTVSVQFTKGNADAQGWIDYIRMNVKRELIMSGNQMHFRSTENVGPGNVSRFDLANALSVSQIWDITDHLNPFQVNFMEAGTLATWKAATDEMRQYIAFSDFGFLTPVPMGQVENQNLHALQNIDLMIVTAPLQLPAAEAFAELHSSMGYNVAIATAPQVYNEFSSGNPDPTAIRMLMKMFYDRAGENQDLRPQNLLLLGDGSYLDNKGLLKNSKFNVITFQSAESLSPTQSYVSDDFFVFLDDTDNESPFNKLDCGIGRIPSSNLQEALDYFEKVKLYVSQNTAPSGDAYCLGDDVLSPFGAWRNNLVFVSDDQDGDDSPSEQIHLIQSDALTDIVAENFNQFNSIKLYMDAFKQESIAGGERYPEGEEAIRQRVQNGALVVTYIGHGGERGWAHERILDIPTIAGWTNKNRLPVFLTATCELARYDDPDYNSAGEILVMNPEGGAIAMLTTTRVVSSGSNFQVDTAFFSHGFDDALDPELNLGKINMLTKNGVPNANSSKPNFSLLGDPMLRMAYPKHEVYTTEINGVDINLFTDTLKSLQEVEFKGFVGDLEGNKLEGFNGFVYPTVYDKESYVSTQNNDGGVVQNYYAFDKVIYKGKASVINGDFTFRFVVPYDINYAVDSGRVSYYAVAGSVDGHGFNESFLIGSSLEGAELNNEGPIIDLFMNDSTFVSGGITNTQPILLARLEDENGINTVGNGIGHDLVAVLDGNTQSPIILNDFYEAALDTYKKGEIRYQMPQLAEGSHNIRLKAWDVHNNSSQTDIDFVVAGDAQIALDHVLNYPNPFSTYTEFFFEHNQACDLLDVQIQVFTVGGKLVKSIVQQVRNEGFRTAPIPWDGRDDFGDKIGRGVYVYKVEVRNEAGETAEKFEKLVILN